MGAAVRDDVEKDNLIHVDFDRDPVFREAVRHWGPVPEHLKDSNAQFARGMISVLAHLLALSWVVVIPLIGPILATIVVPFFAGYRGGRLVDRYNGLLLGFLGGLFWSVGSSVILLTLLSLLPLSGTVFHMDSLGWTVVLLYVAAVVLFASFGGYTGGRRPYEPRLERLIPWLRR